MVANLWKASHGNSSWKSLKETIPKMGGPKSWCSLSFFLTNTICSAEFLHCLVQRCYHLLMILQLAASYSMPFSWLIEIQLLFESDNFAWKISVYSLVKGEFGQFHANFDSGTYHSNTNQHIILLGVIVFAASWIFAQRVFLTQDVDVPARNKSIFWWENNHMHKWIHIYIYINEHVEHLKPISI